LTNIEHEGVIAAEPDQRVGAADADQRIVAARAGADQPGSDHVQRLYIRWKSVIHRGDYGVDAAIAGLGHDIAAVADIIEVVAV
jgi:hypothetical protein